MTATPATFKTVFPTFATVPDATIQYWMEQALGVTSAWGNDHATYLLTAHYLTQQGRGSGAEAELAAAGASSFTSIESGNFKLARGKAGTGFASTSYGEQFRAIALGYVGGPLITSTGTVRGGYGGVARAYPCP